MNYFIEIQDLNEKQIKTTSKQFKLLKKNYKNRNVYGNIHDFDFNLFLQENKNYLLTLYQNNKPISTKKINYTEVNENIEYTATNGYLKYIYFDYLKTENKHYNIIFNALHRFLPPELVEIILEYLKEEIYFKFDINSYNLEKIYLMKPKISINEN